ncbi:MAG: CotH kinase family protein [Spirochaetota bacterium]
MSRRRALLRVALVSAATVVVALAAYLWARSPADTVEFTDEGIELAVRRSIGLRDGPIPARELAGLTRLDAARSGVRDLADLRALPNLTTLDLAGNRIDSIEPIGSLSHLRELDLSDLGTCGQGELDLRPLARSQTLERLDLSGNRACSRFPGLERLTRLESLSLRNTGLSSLDPIDSISRLRDLDLRGTDLADADVSPLASLRAIERLNLRDSGVRRIDALADLTTLTYLNLHSNPGIESLEPVRGLRRLRTLIIRNVPLRDPTILRRLTSLRRLNVRNTGMRELDELASLMEQGALQDDEERGIVAEVDIRDNPIGGGDGAVEAYDALRPYWRGITHRHPERLPRGPTRDLVINEVMTSNGSAYRADDGSFPDWIEIRNRLDRPVDLGGYYLSDVPEDPRAWRIPDGARVEPGRRLMVLATGERADRASSSAAPELVRAPFALSSDGVTIRLTEPDGTTLVDSLAIPAIPRDASYGLAADDDPPAARDDRPEAARAVVFIESSPGRPNGEGRRYVALSASHAAGFHASGFDLTLSADDDAMSSSAEILYTLDGSPPDPRAIGGRRYQIEDADSQRRSDRTVVTRRYESPIRIRRSDSIATRADADAAVAPLSGIPTTVPTADKWDWQPPSDPGLRATVVRAAVYDGARRLSSVVSHTYFVDESIHDRFTTPVVSILAAPDELFGYEKGIYVPGRTFDEERDDEIYWMRHRANYSLPVEVGTHLEYYEPDGYQGVDLDGGIRVHGGWSRSHPLKSLRLYARKTYGRVNVFDYPFFAPNDADFPPADPTGYRRLMLRSGQSLFRSHLQDAFLSEYLAGDLTVDLARARPVVHFINGEYWGIKNLRERFDRFYLEQRYGLDPDRVAIIESPLGAEAGLKHGDPEDARDYRLLLERVAGSDMSDPEAYAWVTERVDVESLIDYNVLRIYSGDPDGVSKHVIAWRAGASDRDTRVDAAGDGRWRFHTWDLDNALMFLEENTMSFYANDAEPDDSSSDRSGAAGAAATGDDEQVRMLRSPEYTVLFAGLLQNGRFRNRFINRFCDLLNTRLHPETLVPAISEWADRIEPEMSHHIARWGYPDSLDSWRSQVDYHMHYARRRPEIQREHIRDYFAERGIPIDEPASLTIAVPADGGVIRVNSIVLDGSTSRALPGREWSGLYFGGVPVEIEAVPEEGYRFAGWGSDANSVSDGAGSNDRLTVDPAGGVVLEPVFERLSP